MSRFTRALALLWPSVQPSDLSVVLSAMEGDTKTPAPSVCGEAALGAGQTPEGEGPVHQLDPGAASSRTPLSPSGPPPCETDMFWEPATQDAAFDLSTGRLVHLLDRWNSEAHA